MSTEQTASLVIEDIETALKMFQDDPRTWTRGAYAEGVQFGEESEPVNSFCMIGGITASMFVRQGKVESYLDPRLNGFSYNSVADELNKLWSQWVEELTKDADEDNEYPTLFCAIEDTNDSMANSMAMVIDWVQQFTEWAEKNGHIKRLKTFDAGNKNKPDFMAITREVLGG